MFGLLAVLCGGTLVIHQILRLARANPDERLPWFGYPSTTPPWVAVLTALGAALLVLGVSSLASATDSLVIPALFIVMLCSVLLISRRHNRQVRNRRFAA